MMSSERVSTTTALSFDAFRLAPGIKDYLMIEPSFGERSMPETEDERLLEAWWDVQNGIVGTRAFGVALAMVTDDAALRGDMEFAQLMGEIYLANRCLLRNNAERACNEGGDSAPAIGRENAGRLKDQRITLPCRAALIGIACGKPAACWVRLLEIALYEMAPCLPEEVELFNDIGAALSRHYCRIGDLQSMERLPMHRTAFS